MLGFPLELEQLVKYQGNAAHLPYMTAYSHRHTCMCMRTHMHEPLSRPSPPSRRAQIICYGLLLTWWSLVIWPEETKAEK